LAITIDNYYWEREREHNCIWNFTSVLPTQTPTLLTKLNLSERLINLWSNNSEKLRNNRKLIFKE